MAVAFGHSDFFDTKVLAIAESADGGESTGDMRAPFDLTGVAGADGCALEGLLYVEGAIDASPVVEAEGVVAGGLNFGEKDTGADCMDGSAGNVEAAVRSCAKCYEIVDHGRAVFNVLSERLRRNAGADTAVDHSVFVSVDNVPCFVFDAG